MFCFDNPLHLYDISGKLNHRTSIAQTTTAVNKEAPYVSKQITNKLWPSHSNWLQMRQMKLPLPAALIHPPPAPVKIPAGIVSPRCRCKCKLGRDVEKFTEGLSDLNRLERSEREMCEQIRLVFGACLWFQWTDGSPGSWGCWQQSCRKEVVDATLSYFALFMIWEALSESCVCLIRNRWGRCSRNSRFPINRAVELSTLR